MLSKYQIGRCGRLLKTQKGERTFETKLKEGNPDLSLVWREVLLRIKRGEKHDKGH